jgi:hypothetical protein
MQQQKSTEAQMIAVAGVVYNRAHIVKVDISRPGLARIFTTGGMDEYEDETARQIAAFFSPPDPVPTEKQRK